MENIHVLPTNKPSRLCIREFDNKLCLHATHVTYHGINQHIYITSDEEIKEGDWYIHKQINYLRVSNSNAMPMDAKKIILTTDQDLINVQAIDDEFLKWFVNNPSCEEVEVAKTNKLIDNYADKDEDKWEVKYHIYLPKEQPDYSALLQPVGTKQETLEEAKRKYLNKCVSEQRLTGYCDEDFENGAKWQEQKMYSEEEVLEILRQFRLKTPYYTEAWFEQFKKK